MESVLFFTDYDDKWQAVKADLPYYSDGWSGTLAPQADADGLVFNYTYTLPQFLRAVYILLTAIRALEPKSLPKYTDVFTKCVNRLAAVHQTITSGIVGTRMPSMADVGTYLPDFTPPYTLNWISQVDPRNQRLPLSVVKMSSLVPAPTSTASAKGARNAAHP